MGFAALAIVVGAIATSRPLGEYLVAGTVEAANAAVTMAWITWWALVAGFAIAGGVEAWVSSEQISDLLEGLHRRRRGRTPLLPPGATQVTRVPPSSVPF